MSVIGHCSNILLDVRDQAIAPPWNCLNVLRVLRIIAKRTPEVRNRFVNNIIDHYRVRPAKCAKKASWGVPAPGALSDRG